MSFVAQSFDASQFVALLLYTPPPEPFSAFASGAIELDHQHYLALDPKASIRSRKIHLPGGEAEEIIERNVLSGGGKTLHFANFEFWFQRGARGYNFTYRESAATLTPSLVTTFQALVIESAESIRFTH